LAFSFPWPESVSEKQKDAIKLAVQDILRLRVGRGLDRAVYKAYCKEPFTSECEGVEYFFALYEKHELHEKIMRIMHTI